MWSFFCALLDIFYCILFTADSNFTAFFFTNKGFG